MMHHFQMFGEHKIALGREVHNHPEVIELLQKHQADDFELMLAEIAAYCEVILEGEYTEYDIEQICKILTQKLVTKRLGIIFPREIDTKTDGDN